MASLLRDKARGLFHRGLFHETLAPLHRTSLRMIRRAHAHLLNCSTDSRANGEEWLIRQLPESGVFLDVGFNRGKWTQSVLEQRPDVFVHGFDPCRDAGDLAHRLGLKPDRFAFHGVALSNEIGKATFHDYGDMNESNSLVSRSHDLASGAAPETYEVDVVTLDQWIETVGNPFIEVLKLDAEGFDLHILEGARELLDRQQIGLIVFEYASGWFASKRTLFEASEYLAERGYALYRLFPFFLAPYRYRVQHEGSLIGYYVALSQEVDRGPIPRRHVTL